MHPGDHPAPLRSQGSHLERGELRADGVHSGRTEGVARAGEVPLHPATDRAGGAGGVRQGGLEGGLPLAEEVSFAFTV